MIQLRALVVDGIVRGFGDSDEGAYRDALTHGLDRTLYPGAAREARDRGLFIPITLEDAKRIVRGDVVWRGQKLAS